MTIKFRTEQQTMNTICVYEPENCKTEDDETKFYEEIQKKVDKIPNKNIVIIMGELNTVSLIDTQDLPYPSSRKGIPIKTCDSLKNAKDILLTLVCE